MYKFEFELAWPPRELNPNVRTHWAVKSKVAREYRDYAFYKTLSELPDCSEEYQARWVDTVEMQLTFCPPDKRKRDDDNIIAAFKSGRDGIAQALRVDDNIFHPVYRVTNNTTPNGSVKVTLNVNA